MDAVNHVMPACSSAAACGSRAAHLAAGAAAARPRAACPIPGQFGLLGRPAADC